MKKTIFLALATSIVVSSWAQTKQAVPVKPTTAAKKVVTSKSVSAKPTSTNVVFKNAKDSASYALGLRIGQSLRSQGLQDVNVAMFNKGMATGVNVKSLIPDSLLDICIKNYQDKMSTEKIAINRAAGAAFFSRKCKKTRCGSFKQWLTI
jgi:FKBP-type peptidyl-prolyl cis-trans isomerase FklB